MRCPGCGSDNKDSAKFCFKCGFKMPAFSPVPEVPYSQRGFGPGPNITTLQTPGANEDLSTRPLSSASILFIETGRQHEIPLKPIVHLGRSDRNSGYAPDIDLTDVDKGKVISRRHSSIICGNGKYKVSDLGSTNGTFLNGIRLQPGIEYDLKNGDEIVFGKVVCVFNCIG